MLAATISDELSVPPPLADCDDDSPTSPRWRHQSLSKGAAGVALLHAARASTTSDADQRVHAWLTRAVCEDLSVGRGAGLWFGTPAVAFALAVSAPDRYQPALARLDAAVTDLTERRLRAADARIAAGTRPALSEFDLVRGLAGLGAYQLYHRPGDALTRRVLDYLVRLTEPVPAHDAAAPAAPGWWTSDAGLGQPTIPGGHANLGMAHGIAGPLALLALASRQEVTVPGQADAIDRICHWLDDWRQPTPTGPWWPERVTIADLRAGRPGQPGPARPSWCYGTPGLARAQQLAAIARHQHDRQIAAEHALTQCLADPAQLARLTDPYLCHGWAGLTATVWYAAADAATPSLAAHLPGLVGALLTHATTHTGVDPLPGLIDGRAGVAITLHTFATAATAAAWPACLLIN
ncbi:hypothetical protein Prum_068910 [Phytohabitans rumicis]|uniref:Lanthionine synthetase n=1 Tax=Phytohabitans rumicis TaxID=1076125 RepID=A0A6V8LF59_9ACTN|nr:hypothetical protein Prum_068910 [Phytohabitans rumicis]